MSQERKMLGIRVAVNRSALTVWLWPLRWPVWWDTNRSLMLPKRYGFGFWFVRDWTTR